MGARAAEIRAGGAPRIGSLIDTSASTQYQRRTRGMTSPQQKKAALSTLQWIQDKQLLERAQDNERMMAELKAAEQMLAAKRRSSNAPASAPLNVSVELARPIDDTEARSLGVSKSQTVV